MDSRPKASRERTIQGNVGGEASKGSKEGLAPHGMKVDIPDDDRELIIKALDHYHAYTLARNAEDKRYQDLADRLKRKPTECEPAAQPVKHTKRRA
jgi:hypothetical protein